MSTLPFHGSVGAAGLMLCLPVFLLSVNVINEANAANNLMLDVWMYMPSPVHLVICVCWLGLHLILYKMLPFGEWVQGTTLHNGSTIMYHCNGLASLVLSWLGVACMQLLKIDCLAYVSGNHVQLLCASYVISTALAILLYIRSRLPSNKHPLLAQYANTGHFTHEFFMGRELNPSVLGVDLKFVCELRPGLIGWSVISWACVWQSTGDINLLLCSFAAIIYVVDALIYEECIVTTMDITDEGFGWMLCFGDLCWVPFLYSLHSRYILLHQPQLSIISSVITATFYKLKFLVEPTSGRKLLVDGWWAKLRHPNYLGDLVMAYSWAAFAGFSSGLPYIYPVYLTVLLITRELRDEQMCAKKYGHTWDRYCSQVPYRIFPNIW